MTHEDDELTKLNVTHFAMKNGFKEVVCIQNAIEDIVEFQEAYKQKFESLDVTENTDTERLIFFPEAQVLYNNLVNISTFYEKVLRAQLMEEDLIENTFLDDHVLSFEGMSEYIISKKGNYFNLKMMVGIRVHIESDIEFPPVFAKRKIIYPSGNDYEYDPEGLIADDEFEKGPDGIIKNPRYLSDTVQVKHRNRTFGKNRPIGFQRRRFV